MGTDSMTSGYKRALRQEFCLAGAFGGRFKYFDERPADDLAFAFRIGHAFETAEGTDARRPRIAA